jgi:hypothetical protein
MTEYYNLNKYESRGKLLWQKYIYYGDLIIKMN